MTQRFFDNPYTVSLLRSAFDRWRDTPFMANSASPGPSGGASCQKLVENLLRECGFAAPETPSVLMAHGRFSTNSIIVPFLEKMEADGLGFILPCGNNPVLIGDILGFKVCGTVHHVGIAGGCGEFFHVIEGNKARFNSLSDPTWFSRLKILFRPTTPQT